MEHSSELSSEDGSGNGAGRGSEIRAGLGLDDAAGNVTRSVEALDLAVQALPIGLWWVRLEDRSIYSINPRFTDLFGYIASELSNVEAWIESALPFAEDRALVESLWRQRSEAQSGRQSTPRTILEPVEVRILCKDSTVKTVIHSGVIVPESGWALSTFLDITERKRHELLFQVAEREARENESIYRLLLDHSPGMIILAPFDKSKRYVSPAVEQLTGFTPQEYLSMRHPGMLHPDDHEGAKHVVERIRAGHLAQVFRYRTLQKLGGYRWVEAAITGYLNPHTKQAAGYIATVRDISEQKIREETLADENRQLSAVASIDELTGIANRRTFNQTLDIEGRRQARAGGELSLLMLDVDYFKQFNDRYGHLAGDACLKKLAITLQQSLRRAGDLAARFGGEEFVSILPMTDTPGAVATARSILQAIAALNIPHAGSPYGVVTASVGIGTWPAGTAFRQSELIERADQALYHAKRAGRNRYHVGEAAESAP